MNTYTYIHTYIHVYVYVYVYLQQPLPRCRTEHADRHSGNSDGSPGKKGLGQHHIDNEQWGCTKLASSARCSTVVKPGSCTSAKNADSTSSICAASEGSWASSGKIVSQTGTPWHRRNYQACLPCSPKGACAGSAMSAAGRTAESLRTFYMESLPLAPDRQAGLFFATKMFVNETWRQVTLTQQAGKLWLQTAAAGGLSSRQASRRANRGEGSSGNRGDSADGIGQHQHPQSQARTTPAAIATEPAIPGSGCTATAGAATQSHTNPQRSTHFLKLESKIRTNKITLT